MAFKRKTYGFVTLGLILGQVVQASLLEDLSREKEDLISRIKGSVVNITTFAQGYAPRMMTPEEYFFGQFFGGPGRMPRRPEKTVKQKLSLGSGFIIDEEGAIITNHHVIDRADEIKVQIVEDGPFYAVSVVGRDPEMDIALLKLKDKIVVKPLKLGDSDAVREGAVVFALGNPFGYGHSSHEGTISAVARKNPESRYTKFIQTSALINPGNSGGPLVNVKGEVIGVNNAIDARGPGISFAIPISSVRKNLEELRKKGKVARGYLGISLATPLDPDAENAPKGALVASIEAKSPADDAGLVVGDLITQVDGVAIKSAQDLTSEIAQKPVGAVVTLKVKRRSKVVDLKTKIRERPEAPDFER